MVEDASAEAALLSRPPTASDEAAEFVTRHGSPCASGYLGHTRKTQGKSRASGIAEPWPERSNATKVGCGRARTVVNQRRRKRRERPHRFLGASQFLGDGRNLVGLSPESDEALRSVDAELAIVQVPGIPDQVAGMAALHVADLSLDESHLKCPCVALPNDSLGCLTRFGRVDPQRETEPDLRGLFIDQTQQVRRRHQADRYVRHRRAGGRDDARPSLVSSDLQGFPKLGHSGRVVALSALH